MGPAPDHEEGRRCPAEFFDIGALAEALGRKPVTIRSWEDKKIIPKACTADEPPAPSDSHRPAR